jgi:hypothetical protein
MVEPLVIDDSRYGREPPAAPRLPPGPQLGGGSAATFSPLRAGRVESSVNIAHSPELFTVERAQAPPSRKGKGRIHYVQPARKGVPTVTGSGVPHHVLEGRPDSAAGRREEGGRSLPLAAFARQVIHTCAIEPGSAKHKTGGVSHVGNDEATARRDNQGRAGSGLPTTGRE